MALLRGFLLLFASYAVAVKPVGFIGLGIMGEGMTINLLKNGVPVHLWSRNRKTCEAFASAAASTDGWAAVTIEDSPAAVVTACERTYLMLSTPAACEEVYTMVSGVLDGVSAGKQIVDCATLRPGDMASLAERVRAKGGTFVEAPVSGSKGPAAAGALIFMAAGDKPTFDAAASELAAMGKKSVYCGEQVGVATNMKLVVNTIMGAQLAALAEGIALAENLNLSVEDMQAVLEEGAMASPMLKLKGPLMAQRAYTPAFPLKYALKDMKFALGLSAAAELGLPVSRAATAAFEVANKDPVLSESDFGAIMEVAAAKKKKVAF